ncbi:hypothetical protein J4234_04715 [Candidatus Woesearchaeota archaeon]|nr:hypothetical protein [Candidatus Woesearchaeota archaeon]
MPTTIQINSETLDLLKKFKGSLNAESYDDVINKILKGGVKKSMYGALGKEKSMKNILRGLRDESDR